MLIECVVRLSMFRAWRINLNKKTAVYLYIVKKKTYLDFFLEIRGFCSESVSGSSVNLGEGYCFSRLKRLL